MLRAWKFWTFLYQIAIILEIAITAVFWSILYPDPSVDICKKSAPLGFHDLRCVNLLGDHSLPLLYLLIDYTYNTQPFLLRHLIPIFKLSVIYLIVNLAYTKTHDNPVYAPMDWDSVSGIVMPLGTLVVSIALFFLIYWINNRKLKK